MNYMKQVAQMLGVEIGEEFKIKGRDGTFKFNEDNLLCRSNGSPWYERDGVLMLILYGKDEIEKHILDEKEKEYLLAVIRPFRDRVKYLFKGIFRSNNSEFIAIAFNDDDIMFFPSFEVGTMYKGMELEKEYTLEDLGL